MKKHSKSIKLQKLYNSLIFCGIRLWMGVMMVVAGPAMGMAEVGVGTGNNSYEVSLENFEQVSENEFQYDIWLRNTGSGFYFDNLWIDIYFNPGMNWESGQISSDGVIAIPESSELVNEPQDGDFLVASSGDRMTLYVPALNFGEAVQFIEPDQKIRVGRFAVFLNYNGKRGVFPVKQIGLEIREESSLIMTCDVDGAGKKISYEYGLEGGVFSTQLREDWLASHFFTGSGQWHARDKDGSYTHWNTHPETHPDLARRLPGPNAGVIIAGHAEIGPGQSVTLTSNGDGEGGELRIVSAPGKLSESGQTDSGNTEPATEALNCSQTDGKPEPAANQAKQMQATNTPTTSSSLRIAPGGSLTVDRLYNDLDDPGAIVLESASGTDAAGSLIHQNEGIKATVQRYIDRWSPEYPHRGWHMISSPVEAMPIRPEFVPEGQIPASVDFYKWDEAHVQVVDGQEIAGWWINSKAAGGVWNNNFEPDFFPGRGYLLAYGPPAKDHIHASKVNGHPGINSHSPRSAKAHSHKSHGDKSHEFTGTLRTADLHPGTLGHAGAGEYAGWHLMGNPFASAIDWTRADWQRHNIVGGPVIWREEYASYSPVLDIIPAMNGFMIHTSGNGSLRIPAEARAHDNASWYKKAENNDARQLICLTAHDPAGHTAQETLLRFLPDATTQFDTLYDTPFKAGHAPHLYSLAGDIPVLLNSMPEPDGALEIPLGFIPNGPAGESSSFYIELDASPADLPLYLEDRILESFHPLDENPVYHFTARPTDPAHRFVLHAGKDLPTGIGDSSPANTNKPRAWLYDQILHVETGYPSTVVEIIDQMGRVVKREQLTGEGLHQLPFSETSGVYFVRIITGKGIEVIRIRSD